MRKINRWGVLALVVLMVLGTMSAALAEDGEPVEEGPTEEVVRQGAELWEFVEDVMFLVLYWGYSDDFTGEADPEEPVSDGSFCEGLFAGIPLVDGAQPPEGSTVECLSVEGPNGQVNHGTFVSAFVHWLKADGMTMLAEALGEGLPKGKGRFVRLAAHHQFGKGFDEAHPSLEAEDDEGGGPPPWAKDKSAKVKGPKKK